MTTQPDGSTLPAWAGAIERMLQLGRTRGYLTYADIVECCPQPELQIADIDQLYAVLHAEGIQVSEHPEDADAPNDPAALQDEIIPELPDLADVALDDPVRMYLKEIGQVPLLTADQEVKVILEAAQQAAEGMQRAIDDNLTECGFNGQGRKMVEDGVRLGTGILFGPFPSRTSSKVWLPWLAEPMPVTVPGSPELGVLAVRLKPRVAPTMEKGGQLGGP